MRNGGRNSLFCASYDQEVRLMSNNWQNSAFPGFSLLSSRRSRHQQREHFPFRKKSGLLCKLQGAVAGTERQISSGWRSAFEMSCKDPHRTIDADSGRDFLLNLSNSAVDMPLFGPSPS